MSAELDERARKLRQEARSFAEDAFEAGHFPNPVKHSVVGCEICQVAMAIRKGPLPLNKDGLWPERA